MNADTSIAPMFSFVLPTEGPDDTGSKRDLSRAIRMGLYTIIDRAAFRPPFKRLNGKKIGINMLTTLGRQTATDSDSASMSEKPTASEAWYTGVII